MLVDMGIDVGGWGWEQKLRSRLEAGYSPDLKRLSDAIKTIANQLDQIALTGQPQEVAPIEE